MPEKTAERPGPGATPPPPPESIARPFKVSADQLLFFNRQLASMARLNMPLAKGLRILAREVDDPEFKGLLESIQRDLDEGVPLQNALMKHPETFSTLYVEILKAGETTGNLAVILDELTQFSEAMIRIKNRIREAILYPLVIMSVVFAFTLFFLIVVAPAFEGAVATMAGGQADDSGHIIYPESVHLPLVTRGLFFASGMARGPIGVIVILGVIALGYWLTKKFRAMGEQYDDFLFRVPLFGKIFHRATLMKLVRTMRDLLGNGVSMVQTLRLTCRTVGHNRIQAKLEELQRAVEEGGSFSRNLSAGEVFPDTMVWKLQMAEEKGVIEDALKELGNEFEAEVEEQATVITKVLSPMMLLGMAVVVFLIFLAAFVPLTQFASGAGG
jgi:type II secretory pathway component PulF